MQSDFSVNKRLASFHYALKGIKYLFTHEPNARIHLYAAFIAILAGILLGTTSLEWIFIALAIAIVFSAEAMNTAIELLTDKLFPEQDKKAGHIKDLAAGAVLMATIWAAITGLIIFVPKIW